jgi:hypothetical protein
VLERVKGESVRHERPARLTKSLLGHQHEPWVHRREAAAAAKAYFNGDRQANEARHPLLPASSPG